MAQGRGNAVVVALALFGLLQVVAAKEFIVGDDIEWTFAPGTNVDYYDEWAAKQTFAPGDKLVFKYGVGTHDVQVVSAAEKEGCMMSTGKKYTSGSDTITLGEAGDYYFLCSYMSHCDQGMKMKVTVSGTAATPPTVAATPPTVAVPPPTVAVPPPTVAVPPPTVAPATPPAAPRPATPPAAPRPATPPPVKSPAPAPVPVKAPTPAPVPVVTPVPAPTPVVMPTPPAVIVPDAPAPAPETEESSAAASATSRVCLSLVLALAAAAALLF